MAAVGAAVSFGLVSVPVKAYAATTNHDIRFHQVHAADGGRIKYKRVCTVDGEEVEYADIVKGYETDDGELETAIAEVSHHRAVFLRSTNEPAINAVLRATLIGALVMRGLMIWLGIALVERFHAADALPRLFEAFARGPGRSREDGLGLGPLVLAVVADALEEGGVQYPPTLGTSGSAH